MNRTALYTFRRVLYSLKRAYPGSVVIHRRASSTPNFETGRQVVDIDSWLVDRAIVLPNSMHREFSYDLAFIAAAKNFTYGGMFDTGIRRVIVDVVDMPSGWKPHKDDYIVYDSIRYEIREIDVFENQSGWLFTLKSLTEQTPQTVIPVHFRSTLHLEDGFEND